MGVQAVISLAVILLGVVLVFTLDTDSTPAWFAVVGAVVAGGLVLWAVGV